MRNLGSRHTEYENIFRADTVFDLDVGAIERADGERTVHRELHVAGAGGFGARSRNLLGKVGGRNH